MDGPTVDLQLDSMCATFGGFAYVELSVILAHLRYLSLLHQTHHWITRGDPFYGDHKLFEELYNGVVEHVDRVAERAVGLGSECNVNLVQHIAALDKLARESSPPSTLPQSNDLARLSLCAEWNFLKLISACLCRLRTNCTLTDGLENLLQDVADDHERYVYLLKRRCTSSNLGG